MTRGSIKQNKHISMAGGKKRSSDKGNPHSWARNVNCRQLNTSSTHRLFPLRLPCLEASLREQPVENDSLWSRSAKYTSKQCSRLVNSGQVRSEQGVRRQPEAALTWILETLPEVAML